MDHVLLLAFDIAGIIGWLIGAFRQRAQLWIHIGVWVAIPWLAGYFVLEMMRAEPRLYSGTAQVGTYTVGFMALGLCALLSKTVPPKSDHDHPTGGALSR